MMSLEIHLSKARSLNKDNDHNNNHNIHHNTKRQKNRITTRKENHDGINPSYNSNSNNNNNNNKNNNHIKYHNNNNNYNNNNNNNNNNNKEIINSSSVSNYYKITNNNCSKDKILIDKCDSDLYKRAVFEILQTVNDLEHSLIEDHQQDYKLRMALERQAENVYDLRTSLLNEKERNQRLIGLLENVNSSSPTDDEYYERCDDKLSNNYNSLNKAYGSISPLLMQQRYDELSISYKQCRHQLIKKEKQLTLCNCEKEMSQAKYDQLVDEYRIAQKRFENLCSRYLRLQKRKNYEIQQLKEALSYASDCVVGAQQIVDNCQGCHTNAQATKEFNQNLQLFIKSLQLCQWNQCHCTSLSSQSK